MLASGPIEIRSPQELDLMRRSAQIVSTILDAMEAAVAPGVTTHALDQLAEKLIAKHGAKPAFKGYHGFPACVCISLNDEVVHGIPSKQKTIAAGDLVKLDFGVVFKGWFADSARTIPVGEVDAESKKLIEVTRLALEKAIAVSTPEHRIGDIGYTVQTWVESQGFNVVRDFHGHGVGRALHEKPAIPNYGEADSGMKLRPGMTIAIEPMVNAGTEKVEVLDDDWTAVTLDRKRSAHFEHTILITEGAPEILTKRA
jgi:methionyl aminopeptidase